MTDVRDPDSTKTDAAGAVPSSYRLPHGEHVRRPWRIHEMTHDFDIEDVWALPATGSADDFDLFLACMARARTSEESSAAARFIWAARWRLGGWFGWDASAKGLGSRVPSLSGRLAPDLRSGSGRPTDTGPFTTLYTTHDEYAAEIANGTMHGVAHLGWVAQGADRYRGPLAVLGKTNGRWGKLYMALIKPFRYAVIYPNWMRQIDREWTRACEQRSEVDATEPRFPNVEDQSATG